MRAGWLGRIGVRGAAWRRRHPRLAIAGLALAMALLGWAGYRAYEDFAAGTHWRAARRALARHDWAEAQKQLAAYLSARPDSPEAHRLAARAARRLDLIDEAKTHLETCRRLDGEEAPATQVEQALLRVHQSGLRDAEKFLRDRVAHDDPDAVEILDVLSTALILDYRLPEAHRCLDDLLRREPDNFDALVRRGWTAQNQAWTTVAVESLQRALDLRPPAHDVRLSLVQNLLTLGRYADALRHVEYLEEYRPDDPDVVFARALCLAGQGHKEQAVGLLDGLLAQEPDHWAALSERGRLGVELDRPEEAEAFLRRAQSLAPPNLALTTRLADCLRLLGKDDEARRYREQVDRLREDTLQALNLNKRLREERPDGPGPYHELACLLLRLNKEQDALHFFRQALEKDPRYRPTHEALAAFYTRAGDTRQAAFHKRQLGPKE